MAPLFFQSSSLAFPQLPTLYPIWLVGFLKPSKRPCLVSSYNLIPSLYELYKLYNNTNVKYHYYAKISEIDSGLVTFIINNNNSINILYFKKAFIIHYFVLKKKV